MSVKFNKKLPSAVFLRKQLLKGTMFEDDEELAGCFAGLDNLIDTLLEMCWEELKDVFKNLAEKIQVCPFEQIKTIKAHKSISIAG